MSFPDLSPEHCSNPDDHAPHAWALGHCDGTAVTVPDGFPDEDAPTPEVGPATLWGAPGNPVPWDLSRLNDTDLDDVEARLAAFADHLNRVYAVRDGQLVLGCWRLHPAVWWELASLYAAWVDAFDSPTATAREAAAWHERTLPRFHERLPAWFGTGSEGCSPGAHSDRWNPTAGKLPAVDQVADRTAQDRAGRRATVGRGLSPHPR